MDGEAVSTLGELRRALRKKREGKQVSLSIVRNRAEQTITVELDQPQSRGPQRVTEGVDLQIIPEEELNRLTAELKAHGQEWRQEIEEALAGSQAEWKEALRDSQEEIQKAQEELQRLQKEKLLDWEKLEKELRELKIELDRAPVRIVI